MPTYDFFGHDRFKMALVALSDIGRAAESRPIGPASLYGHIALIERWLSDYRTDGDLTDIDDARIEAVAGWHYPEIPDGLTGRLVAALRHSGLIYVDEHGRQRFRGWPKHAPEYVKKRIARMADNGGQRPTTADDGGQRRPVADNGGQWRPREGDGEELSVVLSEQQGGAGGENEAPQVHDNGKPAKARRKRTEAPQSTIPPSLDTDAFRAAFVEWRAYRREIRKPVTPSSENRIFSKLEKMGHDHAIASINQSIANGWTGLFDVKPENGRAGGPGSANRLGRVEAPPGKYDWIDKQ